MADPVRLTKHEFPQPIAVQLFKLMMVAESLKHTHEGQELHAIAVEIAKHTRSVEI